REQAQHAVRAATDLLHTILAPCPHRGADVVNRAQAGLLQAPFHAEVEIRGVDADHHRRPGLPEARDQGTAQTQQARQVADHLAETEQRQLADVVPGLEALALHPRPADADEARLRVALAQ